MLITRTSPVSGKTVTKNINITIRQLQEWQSGKPIQLVMSNLSASDREFIMTGISDKEWDSIFSDTNDNLLTEVVNYVSSFSSDFRLSGSRAVAEIAKENDANNLLKIANNNWDSNKLIDAITNKTDFDFIMPYSEYLSRKLEDAGFYILSDRDSEYFYDDSTVYITKKLEYFGPVEADIQIVLKNNYTNAKHFWDNIDPEFYYYNIWKRGPGFKHIHDKNEIKNRIRIVMNQFWKIYDNV